MALVFACLGAAYGTAKSGVGVANMGVLHAEMVMKSIIPIIMAGVLGIYGLIVAVLLTSSITGDAPYSYASYSGYSALAAGLCCGMAGLSAGIAIGIVGDAGVRAKALRRCHPHPHFRRGSRSLRSDCGPHPVVQHHEVRGHLDRHLLRQQCVVHGLRRLTESTGAPNVVLVARVR